MILASSQAVFRCGFIAVYKIHHKYKPSLNGAIAQDRLGRSEAGQPDQLSLAVDRLGSRIAVQGSLLLLKHGAGFSRQRAGSRSCNRGYVLVL